MVGRGPVLVGLSRTHKALQTTYRSAGVLQLMFLRARFSDKNSI